MAYPPCQNSPPGRTRFFLAAEREAKLRQLQLHNRQAIRDAVNRRSRKPLCRGELAGYQQLESVQQALSILPKSLDDGGYFQRLRLQVGRALENNHTEAHNLAEAHEWLCQIAECLHYPPDSFTDVPLPTSSQVAKNMETLRHEVAYEFVMTGR